jgi:hypothetical protein
MGEMRSSVRDHRGVVHSLEYVREPCGRPWVPAEEARDLARRTHRFFQAIALCEVKVKIHARTASRLNNEPHTCLLCMMEEQRVETA